MGENVGVVGVNEDAEGFSVLVVVLGVDGDRLEGDRGAGRI
jgi:hypothetical protein